MSDYLVLCVYVTTTHAVRRHWCQKLYKPKWTRPYFCVFTLGFRHVEQRAHKPCGASSAWYSAQFRIGLDLFNDDTRPSGHISHPTLVNVSQSCFHSLNKLLKSDHIFQVLGLVEVNKLHHIRLKNPASRKNSTMQVSGIVWKRAFNESTVQYSSRHSCNTAHSRSICQ